MARKSRKNINKTEKATLCSFKSMTGIYARLSVEDNHYGEGDSLQNQITYLKEFAERNADEFQVVKTYQDNGATGTNFERSGWQEMIADIKAGKVNCIIVKDFSRIGRNYIEVGNYLEKIFPFLNVRVVSVNDSFDSKKQPFENNLLMNSLTNIVNEYYARDISKKILQAKKVMQDNGEYTSGVFPYGYRRSAENKRKMEPDLEAAPVVRKIFMLRTAGRGCSWIANYLNELLIPSPGLYRFLNGNRSFEKCRQSKWKAENISDILKNPSYLGHTVQGKTKQSHFQNGGKSIRVPRAEWKIAENTHTAIITQEQFDIVAHIAMERKRQYEERMSAHADIPHTENMLHSKVYCGCCGSKMFRRSKVENGVRNYYYYCDSRRRKLDFGCTQQYIRETVFMHTIREVMEKQLQLLGDIQMKWKDQKIPKTKQEADQSDIDRKNKLEESILRIKKQKREIYEDFKAGMLTQEDFEHERKKLSAEMEQYETEIQNTTGRDEPETDAINILNKYPLDVFKWKADEIPIDLLDDLIDRIIVYSSESIEIVYTYSDVIKKWYAETKKRQIRE